MPGANCLYSAVQSHVARSIEVYRCSKFQPVKMILARTGELDLSQLSQKIVLLIHLFGPRIERINLYICQRHFIEDQYYRHETKVTLNPGVIPSLNLPQKSHPSSTITKPRHSAEEIQQKRHFSLQQQLK